GIRLHRGRHARVPPGRGAAPSRTESAEVAVRMKSILFIDPPSFCTTVDGLVAPALRSRPIVIAPPGADRATVLALSDEARLAGITRGMLLPRARKICPVLVILPPNPPLYVPCS